MKENPQKKIRRGIWWKLENLEEFAGGVTDMKSLPCRWIFFFCCCGCSCCCLWRGNCWRFEREQVVAKRWVVFDLCSEFIPFEVLGEVLCLCCLHFVLLLPLFFTKLPTFYILIKLVLFSLKINFSKNTN